MKKKLVCPICGGRNLDAWMPAYVMFELDECGSLKSVVSDYGDIEGNIMDFNRGTEQYFKLWCNDCEEYFPLVYDFKSGTYQIGEQ